MKIKFGAIADTPMILYSQAHVQAQRKQQLANTELSFRKKACILGGILATTAIACGTIIHYIKKGKSTTAIQNIKNKSEALLSQKDINYYNSIISSLNSDGIKVGIDALKSIVAPDQFNKLVRKFKPEHFQAGKQISKVKAEGMSLDEFYKNAVDGNFRVSLHTHSNYSDGKATVEEFLECARRYADKVASNNKNDGLPPFTIALTDHDCVDGCKEAIKIIAQNPDKFKNLRFVAGCEFSVRNGCHHHDITGLALNPFEEKLNKMLGGLRVQRHNIIKNFLAKQPEFNGKKITLEDLAEYEKQHYIDKGKNGKRCIENGSGIVSVRHAIKFYYDMIGEQKNKGIMDELGEKCILPIEKVVSTINKNGGYASLTHPVKSFWRFIDECELDHMRKLGVSGIEVNHQYSPSKISQMPCDGDIDEKFAEITNKYKDYALKYDMFLSGGTDCHEKQVFAREPKITNEFLETKILS